MIQEKTRKREYVATRNACKLCAPLGASMAYKGIEGCVPLIHGSQGCATYVRRYMISHYREPVDIASSNFSEHSTIFGGSQNLKHAISNVAAQYKPKHIGVTTTCLSETIGDNIPQIVSEFKGENEVNKSLSIAHAATPSYCGTHADGFHQAVAAVIKHLSSEHEPNDDIILLPGLLSPADYRYLKEILQEMNINAIFIPDLSETLDNPHWDNYKRIPDGGTTQAQLNRVGGAKYYIQFGEVCNSGMMAHAAKRKNIEMPGVLLESMYKTIGATIDMPIGIRATDRFFDTIKSMTGIERPEKYEKQRGRLIDAYTDGHKYVFGKRAVIYGEEDFVIGMTEFLTEIGIEPVLIASGGESRRFETIVQSKIDPKHKPVILSGADFEEIATLSKTMDVDVMVGHSKGNYIATALDVPLVRVGFPIHDRFGGQRVLHIGYEGAHQLFEKIANVLLEFKQKKSPVGYKYM